MHPGHFHPWSYGYRGFRGGFRGGPSRVLWFFLGGLAATWWHRRQFVVDGARPYNSHCHRPKISAMTPAPAPESASSGASASGEDRPAAPIPGQWQWQGGWSAPGQQRWEEDKERMKILGNQAADAMTEISEATLDSVLSTVESLKAKLAEHRKQRDALQKQLEEEQRKRACLHGRCTMNRRPQNI
ncbi:hypothetical protein PLICRDRAFT_255542 [Plicaturopsis crispa FD-325 SS-3]|nr:hypothetical protein PLICRDRAFT_255542 [Plicaturopsis crispa FD-325 SS-3]